MSIDLLCDLDLDIEKCLQNCPELEGPLLDADSLDQLCLYDDLWANIDPQLFSANKEKRHDSSDTLPSLLHRQTGTNTCDIATPGLPTSPPSPGVDTAPPTDREDGLQGNAVLGPQVMAVAIPTVKQPQQQTTQQQNSTTNFNQPLVLKSGELLYLKVPTNMTNASQVSSVAVSQVALKQESPVATVLGQKRPRAVPSTHDTLTRKQQRMIKNRESACISRQKRKEYVQTLEARLKEAALKNTALLQENACLRKQMNVLEKENESLRSSLSRPASPLSSIKSPTLVMAVVFCLALASIPLTRYSIPVPFLPSSNPNTALLPITTHKSRALLSVGSSSDNPDSHALVALPSAPTNYDMDKEFKRHKKVMTRSIGHTCVCPTRNATSGEGNGVDRRSFNRTLLTKINREMLDCMKVAQSGFSAAPFGSTVDRQKNSLAVIDPTLHATLMDTVYPQVYSERAYEHFKKHFIRDLDNFYLISFKDHVILDAPYYNASRPPQLSVIVPTIRGVQVSPDVLAMLQINCEIHDTRIIHLNLST